MTRSEAIDVAIRGLQTWGQVVYVAYNSADADSVRFIADPIFEGMGWEKTPYGWGNGHQRLLLKVGVGSTRGCRAHFVLDPEVAEKCVFSGECDAFKEMVLAIKVAEVAPPVRHFRSRESFETSLPPSWTLK